MLALFCSAWCRRPLWRCILELWGIHFGVILAPKSDQTSMLKLHCFWNAFWEGSGAALADLGVFGLRQFCWPRTAPSWRSAVDFLATHGTHWPLRHQQILKETTTYTRGQTNRKVGQWRFLENRSIGKVGIWGRECDFRNQRPRFPPWKSFQGSN